jgi:hypothetical protein
MIRGPLAGEKILYHAAKLVSFWNAAIAPKRVNFRHCGGKSRLKESPQKRQERFLCTALDD